MNQPKGLSNSNNDLKYVVYGSDVRRRHIVLEEYRRRNDESAVIRAPVILADRCRGSAEHCPTMFFGAAGGHKARRFSANSLCGVHRSRPQNRPFIYLGWLEFGEAPPGVATGSPVRMVLVQPRHCLGSHVLHLARGGITGTQEHKYSMQPHVRDLTGSQQDAGGSCSAPPSLFNCKAQKMSEWKLC